MKVSHNHGYTVVRGFYSIDALRCSHCDFSVRVHEFHKAGDRSGLGRYNRARAVMVKHLHAEHRSVLV